MEQATTFRRVGILLFAAMAVALLLGSGVAKATSDIQCKTDRKCYGTNGPDSMFGTSGHDIMFALKGNDVLRGFAGPDNLNGQDGEDRILGGPGDDWLKGGDHRDMVRGDEGNDTMTGGSGFNVIRAGDGMKDLIVCAPDSKNKIFFDPKLDRFKDCKFNKSLEEVSKAASSDSESEAVVIGSGPSKD